MNQDLGLLQLYSLLSSKQRKVKQCCVLGPYCGLSGHGGVSMEKELSGNRSQGASALFAISYGLEFSQDPLLRLNPLWGTAFSSLPSPGE